MANNCYNYIDIKGNAEDIKSLSELLKKDESRGQDSGCDIYMNLIHVFGDFGNDAKWLDIYVDNETETSLTITGDSAWCPCLELFTAISKKFPSLVIRYEYEEMGCDFSGWADIENGECTDHCFDYWEGQLEMRGEDDMMEGILGNEIACYETEEELREAGFFNLVSAESQAEILEAFNEQVNQ